MKTIRHLICNVVLLWLMTAPLFMIACDSASDETPVPTPVPTDTLNPIPTDTIQPVPTPTDTTVIPPSHSMYKLNVTVTKDGKTDGFGHAEGIGVYVVNYNNAERGNLLSKGNYKDNVVYRYSVLNNLWTANPDVYYASDQTKASIYCYSPYQSSGDAFTIPIILNKDQSSEQKFNSTGFYFDKVDNILPWPGNVSIDFQNLLCDISVVIDKNKISASALEGATMKIVAPTKASFNMNLHEYTMVETDTITAYAESNFEFKFKALPVRLSWPTIILTTKEGINFSYRVNDDFPLDEFEIMTIDFDDNDEFYGELNNSISLVSFKDWTDLGGNNVVLSNTAITDSILRQKVSWADDITDSQKKIIIPLLNSLRFRETDGTTFDGRNCYITSSVVSRYKTVGLGIWDYPTEEGKGYVLYTYQECLDFIALFKRLTGFDVQLCSSRTLIESRMSDNLAVNDGYRLWINDESEVTDKQYILYSVEYYPWQEGMDEYDKKYGDLFFKLCPSNEKWGCLTFCIYI